MTAEQALSAIRGLIESDEENEDVINGIIRVLRDEAPSGEPGLWLSFDEGCDEDMLRLAFKEWPGLTVRVNGQDATVKKVAEHGFGLTFQSYDDGTGRDVGEPFYLEVDGIRELHVY